VLPSSIAILSPGLLGGSLALAARERMPGTEIRIWARREDSVSRVRSMGLADTASTDAAAIARGAEMALFCMPVGAMAEVAGRIVEAVSADAVITDVGSIKQPVVKQLEKIFLGKAQYMGSHPMAGSEQAGLDAARADLFEGALTILTPTDQTPRNAVDRIAHFWREMGCRIEETTPRAHDEAMALISHLPHLTAAALVRTVLREHPAALDWRGNGFLDSTRVASGPPAMWAEILVENREAMKKAIHAMIENLTEASKLLDADQTGGIEHFLAEAREARDRIKKRSTS